jgi:hypothetical protein
MDGARRQPRHGFDRQRLAGGIPGDRVPSHARNPRAATLRRDPRATAKLERNLRGMPELNDLRCAGVSRTPGAPTS